MKSIIANTDYAEHRYKTSDLVTTINTIEFVEEIAEDILCDIHVKRRHESELQAIRDIRALLGRNT